MFWHSPGVLPGASLPLNRRPQSTGFQLLRKGARVSSDLFPFANLGLSLQRGWLWGLSTGHWQSVDILPWLSLSFPAFLLLSQRPNAAAQSAYWRVLLEVPPPQEVPSWGPGEKTLASPLMPLVPEGSCLLLCHIFSQVFSLSRLLGFICFCTLHFSLI